MSATASGPMLGTQHQPIGEVRADSERVNNIFGPTVCAPVMAESAVRHEPPATPVRGGDSTTFRPANQFGRQFILEVVTSQGWHANTRA
jgi:hypothetical protein